MGEDLGLDVHGLIGITGRALPQGAAAFLAGELSLFTQPPAATHIHMEPLTASLPVNPAMVQMSQVFGFCLTRYRGEGALVYLRGGQVERVLLLSDPLRLCFVPHERLGGRLWLSLLFAIRLAMARQGGLLLHGAVVEKGGEALLLAGHRGSGKSRLLLPLLAAGWRYVSDDKFLLHQGKAYPLQDFIYLRDYHLDAAPWLAARLDPDRSFRRRAGRRRVLSCLLAPWLPDPLAVAINRRLHIPLKAAVADLLPDSPPLKAAVPTRLILVRPGEEEGITALTQGEGLAGLALTQRLIFADFIQAEEMACYHDAMQAVDGAGILARNLSVTSSHRLTLGAKADPHVLLREFT